MSQNIELRIEELVLHGFAPGDRHRIGDAVEHELARLLVERGVPPSLLDGGGTLRLNGGEFEVAPDTTERTGARVARAVYGGLISQPNIHERGKNDGEPQLR